MFQFLKLNKSVIVYVALVITFVGALVMAYLWGDSNSDKKIIEQEAREFQDTTDRINQGLNEVRRANPSRDANTALDRLRERQSAR